MTDFILASINPLAAFATAFLQSDSFGKFIVALQMLFSIVLVTIMIGKWKTLSHHIRAADLFRREFSSSDRLLEYYFAHSAGFDPLTRVYDATVERMRKEFSRGGEAVRSAEDAQGRVLSPASIALIKGVAEENLSRQSQEIEQSMGFLAAGASLAPLLGLLGTVTGVLFSFQSMAERGSVNLSAVAPGLSSAMLTTVVGIIVAIPSVVSYNILLSSIRRLHITLDGFTDELLGRILSEFGEGER